MRSQVALLLTRYMAKSGCAKLIDKCKLEAIEIGHGLTVHEQL